MKSFAFLHVFFRSSRFVNQAHAAISISIVDLEDSPGSGVQAIALHFGGCNFHEI